MKACTRCSETKPVSEFYARASKRDGLHAWCKACCRADTLRSQAAPGWAEHKAAYDRGRVARLKPQLAAQARARYARTREEKLAAARRWADANPEARRVISMNYKSRRRSQQADGMTSSELKAWIALQEKRCFWCDTDCDGAYHVDHIYPLARGGKHEAPNLVISCPTCNLRKQAMAPEVWIERILLEAA